jgi:hypothetical protein
MLPGRPLTNAQPNGLMDFQIPVCAIFRLGFDLLEIMLFDCWDYISVGMGPSNSSGRGYANRGASIQRKGSAEGSAKNKAPTV